MDTVTVVVTAKDSNAPVVIQDDAEGTIVSVLTDNTMVQAALAGLVLFALMGALIIRGQTKTARENERRMRRVNEMRESRGIVDLPQRRMVQKEERTRTPRQRQQPSIFDEFKKR